jgi:hypothetical protein
LPAPEYLNTRALPRERVEEQRGAGGTLGQGNGTHSSGECQRCGVQVTRVAQEHAARGVLRAGTSDEDRRKQRGKKTKRLCRH